ncbi:MAG TPA: DUF1800 domain-containing protein [Tepidisphaeraceae bacterium]|jgi:uncharacterized protein (DUF1800 family)|nr:DUF1800 domain-containing protein [Tepidisphaeraceae bacterium]
MPRVGNLVWTLLLLLCLFVPASAQAADDDQPERRPLTEQELLRKRINESLAGVRDPKAPKIQTLHGPELSDREKVVHVLSRLGFGPTPGEVDEVLKTGGWQAWVKRQMDPVTIDDATCDRVINEKFKWASMSMTELQKEYDGDNQNIRQLHREVPEYVVTRAVLSNRQFYELMCDFWRNHFCVDQPETNEKSRSWTDADYENTVIRKNVFAHFGDMLMASAHHPAMLEYLDNKLSRADAWNENYAREVMELHTLGADRGYGNLDVQELSKVLTGWNYDDSFQFIFRPEWQQKGPKLWLGMRIPEGYEGGMLALNTLATHPNTAQFISEKLCRYLVNDNPPPTLVRHVAQVFRQTKGDLPKVYMAIISSREFMSRENYRAKFKTPFQFTVSALRATGAKLNDANRVATMIGKMGEQLYNCADPTGYFDTAERWMDSGVLTTRWQFSWDLVRGAVGGAKMSNSFFDRYQADKPEEIEQKMIEDLTGGDAGDRELVALKDAAAQKDIPKMTSIMLGSPSFQQR